MGIRFVPVVPKEYVTIYPEGSAQCARSRKCKSIEIFNFNFNFESITRPIIISICSKTRYDFAPNVSGNNMNHLQPRFKSPEEKSLHDHFFYYRDQRGMYNSLRADVGNEELRDQYAQYMHTTGLGLVNAYLDARGYRALDTVKRRNGVADLPAPKVLEMADLIVDQCKPREIDGSWVDDEERLKSITLQEIEDRLPPDFRDEFGMF